MIRTEYGSYILGNNSMCFLCMVGWGSLIISCLKEKKKSSEDPLLTV